MASDQTFLNTATTCSFMKRNRYLHDPQIIVIHHFLTNRTPPPANHFETIKSSFLLNRYYSLRSFGSDERWPPFSFYIFRPKSSVFQLRKSQKLTPLKNFAGEALRICFVHHPISEQLWGLAEKRLHIVFRLKKITRSREQLDHAVAPLSVYSRKPNWGASKFVLQPTITNLQVNYCSCRDEKHPSPAFPAVGRKITGLGMPKLLRLSERHLPHANEVVGRVFNFEKRNVHKLFHSIAYCNASSKGKRLKILLKKEKKNI